MKLINLIYESIYPHGDLEKVHDSYLETWEYTTTFKDEFGNDISIGFFKSHYNKYGPDGGGYALGFIKSAEKITPDTYALYYDITLANDERYYGGSFDRSDKMNSNITHYMKILQTIVNISVKFLEKIKPDKLIIEKDYGEKNFSDLKQKIYSRIASRDVPPGYTFDKSSKGDVIFRRSDLNEINKQDKENISYGKEHAVFPINHQPDKVVKIAFVNNQRKNLDPEMFEYFQKHPDVFPTVFKLTPTYVILSKLDVSRVSDDEKKLYYDLDKLHLFDNGQERFYTIFDYIYYLTEPDNKKMGLMLAKRLSNKKIFLDYFKLLLKARKIFNDADLDLHAGNFGYDSEGNIKLLDY